MAKKRKARKKFTQRFISVTVKQPAKKKKSPIGKSKLVKVQLRKQSGDWLTLANFLNAAMAENYARALHKSYPKRSFRVCK